MNEALIDDLKQFIETTVSQTEARLRTEIRTAIAESEVRLTERMDSGFSASAEAYETLSKQADDDQSHNDTRLEDHKARIDRLEQSAA